MRFFSWEYVGLVLEIRVFFYSCKEHRVLETGFFFLFLDSCKKHFCILDYGLYFLGRVLLLKMEVFLFLLYAFVLGMSNPLCLKCAREILPGFAACNVVFYAVYDHISTGFSRVLAACKHDLMKLWIFYLFGVVDCLVFCHCELSSELH